MKNAWFVFCSEELRARERLICFPYAGGNAYLFRPWAAHLPGMDLIAVQTPGKGARLLERPYTTIPELVEALLEPATVLLRAKPFSFFGHSNGALIAFELSCVLQERGLPMPKHLFLSASAPPWARSFQRKYASMSDAEFIHVLRRLNGTPSEVLEDGELFGLIRPGLEADFSLAERYKFSHARKLSVATTVYYGAQDEIDAHHIQAWQDQIEGAVKFEEVPGGHFFIHSHLEMLTRSIAKELRAARAEAPVLETCRA